MAKSVKEWVDERDNPQEDARAFLGAIVESSEDAIISKTLEGRILTWNGGAERLFGYTAQEAVGQPITIIIPVERHGEEETILSRLRRGERIEHFETVRVAKDGREIDIMLSVSPVRDRNGRIIAAAKVAHDITALKRTEEALREADQRKDEFLAILAHELRNPLAPISNSLHILRLSGELSPAMEQIRGVMERQVNQLVRLVDDLLEASRIKHDRIELRKEHVELAGVLRSAIETSRPIINAAGHQLAIALPAEVVLLNADPVRIAQVVSNLLNNAAKYTPDGGQIWLTAKAEAGEAIISVRDTGIGIPPAALTKVFDMYTQADDSLERSQGGLGIGLTLAKHLVQLHGGRIEAASEGVGKGSEFIVRLPLATTSPQAAATSPAMGRSLTARRILIADDRRDAVFVLGKLLEEMGQEVQIVHSAAAALDVARSEPPDVLISDIAMPGMDGYELAQRVRRESAFRDVVLVALSGYGNLEDRERAKLAGFDFHLIKPVSWDALERLLTSLPTPNRGAEVSG
jgi:PAS domain S-box-containing protein